MTDTLKALRAMLTPDTRQLLKVVAEGLMPWLRHKPDCKAGSHCENRFCHHNGSCTCGLDGALNAFGVEI